MTRVLVVGGGGYVGCVLTEELLAKGYSVRVLDRLFFGREALGSPLAGPAFAPVAFRMGTVFGFSPRMRYDLVVNAFVKDALSQGKLNVIYGGSMWRPLIDVKDVARAFVTALECDPAQIRGETFNLVGGNLRISEVALRTRRTLT